MDNLIVSPDTSTVYGELCWLTGLQSWIAAAIICVPSATEWLVSNVATLIPIRTNKISTASKTLPPWCTFVSRNLFTPLRGTLGFGGNQIEKNRNTRCAGTHDMQVYTICRYTRYAGIHDMLVYTICWYTRCAGTHDMLVYTICRYTRYAGIHDMQVYTICWYTRCAGTHDMLVHTICWYTRYAGIHDMQVYTICWNTRYAGIHDMLVYTMCWYTRCAGIHDVLVYAICWLQATKVKATSGQEARTVNRFYVYIMQTGYVSILYQTYWINFSGINNQ
jgi:hypothetical protein